MAYECRGCGNKEAYRIRSFVENGVWSEECDQCSHRPAAPLYDCYVPVGGMHFEGLSHPDYPKSFGGHFCPDKATKAYYLKKYGLQEAGDRRHGNNNFDKIAARHARESLRK